MSFDLIALAILGLFCLFGAFRGGLAGAIGLVALGLGYAAAVVAATGPLADWMAARGVPGLLSAPAAGTAAFVVAYVGVAVVGFVLQRVAKARRGDDPRGGADRAWGAVFGVLRGLLVVLLLSILATWVEAARELGVWEPNAMPVPSTHDSLVAGASGQIVEGVVAAAAGGGDSRAGRIMGRIASNPAPALKDLQGVVDDPEFQALQNDRFFWTLVENGASERAINSGSFYRITHDAELRRQLADLGVVSQAAAEDTDVFRRDVAAMLDDLGPRLKGVREDPELQRLAEDPQVMSMVEAGDTLGLLMHPGIQKLVSRLSEEAQRES
jgi:membrane protein required for colicin V production